MNSAERKEFLMSRQRGIGGSDSGSLMSNIIKVQYGCERSLWARLSGIPADNPEIESELLLLGNICEPFVRRAYSEQTGRKVTQAGLTRHASQPSMQYHDDGVIHPAPVDVRTTNGVLEVKGIGIQMMRKVESSGLPIDYVCQVQTGLAVHATDWGAFALGVREDILPLIAIEQAAILSGNPMPVLPRKLKITHFEVERDQDIIDAIEEKAPAFWATIGDMSQAPPRMDTDDHRCMGCVRRNWCQGAAAMAEVLPENDIPERPDLAPLVEEYQANAALLESCEALVSATEKKFKEVLGGTTAVKFKVDGKLKNIIYRLRKGAERVDGRAMANHYDAMRRVLIAAGLPGIEDFPVSSHFETTGSQSRPLLLKGLLPKKEKAVVSETAGEEDGE